MHASIVRNARNLTDQIKTWINIYVNRLQVLMVRDLSNNSEGNTQVDFVGTVVKIVSKEVGDR